MSGDTGFTHPEIPDFAVSLPAKPIARETLLRKLDEALALESRTKSYVAPFAM
jgi:hypothetical protein